MEPLTNARAALREMLRLEGATSIWVTAQVIQARAQSGRKITLIREPMESSADLSVRALAAIRSMADERLVA